MNVSRRCIFKLAAGAVATGIVEGEAVAATTTATPVRDASVAMLVDTTLCVGCRGCEAACSEANGLPAPALAGQERVFERRRKTDSQTYTVVNRFAQPEGPPRFAKTQCLHCADPACASACLVKAFEKTPEGPVVYHPDRCIGCRYCMVACPFGIPKFEYERAVPYVQKCTFCAGRLSQGLQPACAEVCPTGALRFGSRRELLEVAKARIYQRPGRFVRHVYGEHEVGGTSWLYISDVPFENLGLRTDVGTTPYPEFTRPALSFVPMLLVMVPPFLMGLYSFSRARKSGEAVDEEARHD